MRLFSFSLFVGLFILCSCRQNPPINTSLTQPHTETVDVENEAELLYPFAYPGYPVKLISAHRGGGMIDGYPENCLESAQFLVHKTGCWLEVDVRVTKDGELVLMHDASLDRTTTGTGRLADNTWDQLSQLLLKDQNGQVTSFRPVRLIDFLEWNETEGQTVLTLDVKQDVDYEDLLAVLRKADQIDNVIVITYSLSQAKALRRINNDIVINVPIRGLKEWDRFRDSGLSTDKIVAWTGTIRSPKELYDLLHDHGMLTVFGTLGNIDKQAERRGYNIYQEIYDSGADVISTDRPLAFK